MKLFLRDQSATLASRLPGFRATELSYETTAGLPETMFRARVSTKRRDLRQCDMEFLFHYDVFPSAVLRFCGDWQLERRAMRVGDTIVQQAQIPPRWGFHVIFAVRVLSVEHDAQHASFSYGTLRGHPETGVNAFSFSTTADGIDASVRTTAVPGLRLSRLLAPVFTNRYVRWCNRRALEHMCTRFVEFNP